MRKERKGEGKLKFNEKVQLPTMVCMKFRMETQGLNRKNQVVVYHWASASFSCHLSGSRKN